MLRFVDDSPDQASAFSRREWLRIGGCGLGSALLSGASGRGLGSESLGGGPGFGKARSVLLIYASGGQSQLDMWDPKPEAPVEIRGEFSSIGTRTPGLRLGEHMPRLAGVMDRCTVLRTMSHDDVDHGSATYLALTGQFHAQKSGNPPISPNDIPTYGSVLTRVRPCRTFPYTSVHVNAPALTPVQPAPGQTAGLLGRGFDPLEIGDVSTESIVIPELQQLPGLPPVRHDSRRTLLESIDRHTRTLEGDRRRLELDAIYRQAYELLSAPQCRKAFDVSAEPKALRDRYGRHRTGQACLLGRRLVEAGVPWVTVIWNNQNRGQDHAPGETDAYGWDTHNDIFDALKKHLLPRFDVTLSVLLEDMDQRGLLDTTLVVCMGEFGRAPVVAHEAKFKGASPGRKHWASAYSILLAGAGIKRGATVGETDATGGYPATTPYSPGDLSATMFGALGIDAAGHFQDPEGRPYPIATGRPIHEAYAG